MYPTGLGQLLEGWTKNLSGGAGLAPLLPTLGAVIWVAAGASVTASTFAMAWQTGSSPARWWPLLGWAVLAIQTAWMLRRIGSFKWWAWAVFPVPLIGFLLIFLRSSLHRLGQRRVRWRGRDIDLHNSRT